MKMNKVRDIFFKHIVEYIEKGEDIIFVSADLAAPALDVVREKFPMRFVNVGIAEQNLIAVSAGLALEGKRIVAYTANPFVITRGYDQIRNCVSIMHLPICIVGMGAGLDAAAYGATHYITEDIAMIRMCPNVNIYNISDENMAEWLGINFLSFSEPSYIRMDRYTDGIYIQTDGDYDSGYRIVSPIADTVIITTGQIGLEMWSENREDIADRGIGYIDIFMFPFNETRLVEELKKAKRIIIVDENNHCNGLSSIISSIITKNSLNVELMAFDIDFTVGFPSYYGNRKYILKQYGLTWENIKSQL